MAQRKQKNKVNTTKPNNVTSTTTTNTIFPFNVELLRNITPPLDVLIYPTIADMNAALGRIGTFYEHIKLSNKYLNRKEFKSEWKQIRRFQGFNFPMKVIFEWLEQANYTDLTEQEICTLSKLIPNHVFFQSLLESSSLSDPAHSNSTDTKNILPSLSSPLSKLTITESLSQLQIFSSKNNIKDSESNSTSSHKSISFSSLYIIATTRSEMHHLTHELRHVLYFFDSKYRTLVHQVWNDLDTSIQTKITSELMGWGYAERVWIDEFQAYVSEDSNCFGKKLKFHLDKSHALLSKYPNLNIDLNLKEINQN